LFKDLGKQKSELKVIFVLNLGDGKMWLGGKTPLKVSQVFGGD